MTSMDDVVAAVQAYGETLTAPLVSDADSLRAQLAALQAQYDALYRSTIEVIEFSDFTYVPDPRVGGPTVGKVLPNVFAGKGPGRTVLQMRPGSSTKAAKVAAIPDLQTNPFCLLSVGARSAAGRVSGIDVGGFTVQGTEQGHLYNGLFVGYSDGAHIHDIDAHAIPGGGSHQPKETFSMDGWHADNSLWENLNLTGDGVAASLLGMNSMKGFTVRNCKASGAVYGMGFTGYKCADFALIDLDASGNRRPLNFEQCGGTIAIPRPDLRRYGQSPPITVNSMNLGRLGSAKVTITDPIVDSWPLRVGVTSDKSKNNTQLVSDIKLWVGGEDRTGDKSYLLCGDVW
jgi:hypothetical protein